MAMSFWLLLVCVVGISNGPVGLVVFFETEVVDRVIELKLTTKEKVKKSAVTTSLVLFIPVLIVVPILVYFVNGAKGFREGLSN
jgi:hypothetical protein